VSLMAKKELDEYEKKFIVLMKSGEQGQQALLDLFHQIRSDIKKLEPQTNIEAINDLQESVKKLNVQVEKITNFLEKIIDEFSK
jgi:uncharacterized protein YoxC